MSDNPLKNFRAGAADLDPDRAERMRQSVLRAVAEDEVDAVLSPAGRRRAAVDPAGAYPVLEDYPVERTARRRRSPAPVFAALLVVITVLAVVAMLVNRGGSAPSGDDLKPLPDLRSVAGAANAMPDQPLIGTVHQYRRKTSLSSAAGQIVTEEAWVMADGTGLVRNSQSSGSLAAPGTTAEVLSEDRDIQSTRQFGGWFYGDLRSLPTDAAALRTTLAGSAGGGLSNAEVGRLATDLVSWTSTPPAVRSAAFQVLNDVGFTYVDDVAVQGRSGQRWALTDDAGTHVVVVDPGSTRPLAFYDVPPGTSPDFSNADRWVVYEEARFRDSAG